MMSLVMFSGCSQEQQFNIVPVSGILLLDDKPLGDVSLRFNPRKVTDDPIVGPPSVATTDQDGRFQLTTVRGSNTNGAVAGPHRVTFQAIVTDEESGAYKLPVPVKYEGGIDAQVPTEGTENLVISLSTWD
ncbi:transthyretin-like family protein [Calycomorphotria hydatis]|uniref:Carboxypeptidase regulatory-like domain-containing protein n=1 Tax=Calycomorphotria hydatis TaxID=2528027 RepID=A0A517T8L8_9PLAN|nr:hypothetical protein [Calycomorphotria hydatis]QDT64715.1 hypothetical protein V22_19560 [Calycomorphotria hydatis]